MLLPLFVALIYRGTEGDTNLWAFVFSFAITCLIGVVLRLVPNPRKNCATRRSCSCRVWLDRMRLFGALPYLFNGVFGHIDGNILVEFSFCFFESMSGFTTTGATVLTQIEGIPQGILFWRSFTHG